jgi:hypothetical protein
MFNFKRSHALNYYPEQPKGVTSRLRSTECEYQHTITLLLGPENFETLAPLLGADEPHERAVFSLAEAVNDYYFFRPSERPVPLAMLDDLAAHNLAHPRQPHQLFRGRRVDVYARLIRLRLRSGD